MVSLSPDGDELHNVKRDLQSSYPTACMMNSLVYIRMATKMTAMLRETDQTTMTSCALDGR